MPGRFHPPIQPDVPACQPAPGGLPNWQAENRVSSGYCYLYMRAVQEGVTAATDTFFDETREQSLVKTEIVEKYFDARADTITGAQDR